MAIINPSMYYMAIITPRMYNVAIICLECTIYAAMINSKDVYTRL